MHNPGLMPEKTTDPGEAFTLWQRDGAVILTVGDVSAQGTADATKEVFGPHLAACQGLSRVAANEDIGADTYYDPVTRTVHANTVEQLGLHVDAYMAFGDHYPDLNALLCERQAPSGGDNFLVDGRAIVDGISADPAEKPLADFIWGTAIEQGRTPGAGPKGTGDGLPHRRPIAVRTTGQRRLAVVFHQHQRLLDDQPHDDA